MHPECSSLLIESSNTCEKGEHYCNPVCHKGGRLREVKTCQSHSQQIAESPGTLTPRPKHRASEARWKKVCETHSDLGLGERAGEAEMKSENWRACPLCPAQLLEASFCAGSKFTLLPGSGLSIFIFNNSESFRQGRDRLSKVIHR